MSVDAVSLEYNNNTEAGKAISDIPIWHLASSFEYQKLFDTFHYNRNN